MRVIREIHQNFAWIILSLCLFFAQDHTAEHSYQVDSPVFKLAQALLEDNTAKGDRFVDEQSLGFGRISRDRRWNIWPADIPSFFNIECSQDAGFVNEHQID